jgi:hypothetical protein
LLRRTDRRAPPDGMSDINGLLGLGLDASRTDRLRADTPEEREPLTARAMAAMHESFAIRDHNPSPAQMAALEDVARNVEQMADGRLANSVYLSSLDPGVGKTQAVIHSVRELLRSKRHEDIGMIFFLSRLAEIKTIVAEIGLHQEQFAVLVANSSENSHLNTLGNRNRDRARVLFTTQQMLQSRSRGKKFAEVEDSSQEADWESERGA